MNVKETYEAVKAHVIRHKEAYIVGLIGVASVGITILIFKNQASHQPITIGDTSNALILRDKSKIENVNFISPGNAGNVVQDTTTGIIYPSQEAAAKALGILDRGVATVQYKIIN